jgi:hypothetical protein
MRNTIKPGRINIVMGSMIFLPDDGKAINDLRKYPYIGYQLEQLDADHGLAARNLTYYRFLEAAAHIWDYSPVGMRFLSRTRLRDKISFLPPAYHPSLEKVRPAEERDIDVLFYGSLSERRMRVVRQLKAAGVNVIALFGVYGEALHGYIRRSKIVLNMHGTSEMAILETVRLSFLLANRCFVISEVAEYNPYGDGVVFAPYDDLVAACLRWLAEGPERRRQVAERGYVNGRRIDMASNLAREIDRLPLAKLLPRVQPG